MSRLHRLDHDGEPPPPPVALDLDLELLAHLVGERVDEARLDVLVERLGRHAVELELVRVDGAPVLEATVHAHASDHPN